MKNKSVEMMVRTQFNVEESIKIHVEFLSSNGNYGATMYSFEVWWLDSDVLHQVNCELPHLNLQTKQLV